MVSDFSEREVQPHENSFVGIDIVTQPFSCRRDFFDGEMIIELFKFTNDADELLVSKLNPFDKNSIIIGS